MKRSSRPPRRLTILVALAGGVIAFGAFPRLGSQEPAAFFSPFPRMAPWRSLPIPPACRVPRRIVRRCSPASPTC